MARKVVFHPSVFRTLTRMALWMVAGLAYALGILADALTGRNTVVRRAKRLRRIFEWLGPTFIKLGQQMSVRADVIPYEYCAELSEMLDSAPPFPTKQAIRIIEEAIGQPVSSVFSQFEEQPIGSASLSCVYKAQRHGGQWVAVKVRRPGVGVQLAADLRAFGWMLQLLEWLTLIRPGLTKTLRVELGSMLLEELDFRREARNTELFRLGARDDHLDFVHAPEVHFDLSTESVMVMGLVSGVFLNDLLKALDRNDVQEISRIRALGIDPHVVAHRLILAVHWELLEAVLFHADPHPANILIQPDNQLVFIDFGSCGRISGKTRRIWRQFYYDFSEKDVMGMVERAIEILEPIPPIDVDALSKEIEAMFWDWVHAMKSQHSEWWEKAGGIMWMRFAGMTRRYGVPMTPDVLRIFRATFLYDTSVFRLYLGLHQGDEFARYHKDAGRRARKRIRRSLSKRLERGLTLDDYVRLEDLSRMGRQIVTRVQHYLDIPQLNFARVISKVAFAATLFLRLVTWGIIAFLVLVPVQAAYDVARGTHHGLQELASDIHWNQRTALVVAVLAWLLVRRVLMRIQEMELR